MHKLAKYYHRIIRKKQTLTISVLSFGFLYVWLRLKICKLPTIDGFLLSAVIWLYLLEFIFCIKPNTKSSFFDSLASFFSASALAAAGFSFSNSSCFSLRASSHSYLFDRSARSFLSSSKLFLDSSYRHSWSLISSAAVCCCEVCTSFWFLDLLLLQSELICICHRVSFRFSFQKAINPFSVFAVRVPYHCCPTGIKKRTRNRILFLRIIPNAVPREVYDISIYMSLPSLALCSTGHGTDCRHIYGSVLYENEI